MDPPESEIAFINSRGKYKKHQSKHCFPTLMNIKQQARQL